MIDKHVEIEQLGSIYFNMTGIVIDEYEEAVLVDIPFTHDENHKVMFYKFQVKVIN